MIGGRLVKRTPTVWSPRVIDAFHRWITERALGETLIDVADYRHVYQGPGITLIGHLGNYHWDDSGGQLGLAYVRKRIGRSGVSALAEALHAVMHACHLLERELGREGALFDAGSFEVRINDRTEDVAMLQPAAFAELVSSQLSNLYPVAPVVGLLRDLRVPAVRVRCGRLITVGEILARLTQPTRVLPVMS